MSQSLTLELSEQLFAAIQQQAQAIGLSPSQLAATLLEKQFTQTLKLFLDDTEKNAARTRFEDHFGTLALNDSIDLDNELENETIDADLVREYTNTHEEE